MNIYVGIDLHSHNSVLALIDEQAQVIYEKRLNNDVSLILNTLSPYQSAIIGIVIESTYNWYWLVDALEASGYKVHLAHPVAMVQYSGLKYTDDYSDARWLAEQLKLNILATGYIYPQAQRGLRELVRKRMKLVQQRTQSLLSLQAHITRYSGTRLSATKLKQLTEQTIKAYILDEHNLQGAVVNFASCKHNQRR